MAAAFVFSVSCWVSSSSASTPPSSSPRAWTAYASCTSSKVTLRVTEIERVPGPMAPTTNRVPATSRARPAPARAISYARSASPYSPRTYGAQPNVLVDIMSAPASR